MKSENIQFDTDMAPYRHMYPMVRMVIIRDIDIDSFLQIKSQVWPGLPDKPLDLGR